MRFYKDTNGVWLCNNRVAISGTLDAAFHGTDVVIKKLGQDSVDAEYYRGPITNIEKETAPGAGTFISVTDKADFLLTYKDFFVNPLNPLKEDVEGLQQDVSAIQGGYLGTLLHTDAAPEPGLSGIYKFISAGVVSWLSGTPTVAVGDEVSVVFTDPTYTYTHIQNPYELLANKQNSLAADGTGSKYPTVDAVNAMIVGELGDSETKVVNQKTVLDTFRSGMYGNDWYDPDFRRRISCVIEANTVDEMNDFATLSTIPKTPWVLNGENCLRIISSTSILADISPAFSRKFFTKLGYEDGDYVKIGCWVKSPYASAVSTRRIYKGKTTYESDAIITLNSPDWVWVELNENFIVDSSVWQKFYIGIRDTGNHEEWFIKGLTLQNITKNPIWIGERKSFEDYRSRTSLFLNINPFVENIYSSSPQYVFATELNSRAFTKEIIDVNDFGIKGLRFTGSVGAANQEFRLNLKNAIIGLGITGSSGVDMYNLPKKSAWLKIGFWVRTTTDISTLGIYFYDPNNFGSNLNDFYFYPRIPKNKWYWYETLAVKLEYGIKSRNYLTQITLSQLNDGDSPVIEVCGMTMYYGENPIDFKYNPLCIAKDTRFYAQTYTSYGDSITAADKYQFLINKKFGTKHYLRGCGGSTMVNNGAIFWADADGKYIDRPPASPPSGTEGVDYFTTDAGMCTQGRVNTIPEDTNLFTILAGANDYGQNVPLGARTDAASDAVGATFWAAWKSFFTKLQARIPNASVFVVNLPHKSAETTANGIGKYYYEYRNVIREVCDMFGVPCVETNNLGVNDINWSNYSADDIHPNEQFHLLIGTKIADEIEKYSQYDKVKSN